MLDPPQDEQTMKVLNFLIAEQLRAFEDGMGRYFSFKMPIYGGDHAVLLGLLTKTHWLRHENMHISYTSETTMTGSTLISNVRVRTTISVFEDVNSPVNHRHYSRPQT